MKIRHIIYIVLAFIIVAAIVQGLFCLQSDHRYFQANWTAGEILTYIGTVFLGIIAIWQNAKYKESNDEAEEKLRKLADDANQLSFISKVIEYELVKKEKLEQHIDTFHKLANTQKILELLLGEVVDPQKVMRFEKELDDSFLYLKEELQNATQDEDVKYYKSVSKMNTLLKNAISLQKKHFGEKMPDSEIQNMKEFLDLIQEEKQVMEGLKNRFLNRKQKQLDKLIYDRTEDYSKIKSIY